MDRSESPIDFCHLLETGELCSYNPLSPGVSRSGMRVLRITGLTDEWRDDSGKLS
jgi:hypothetical protein